MPAINWPKSKYKGVPIEGRKRKVKPRNRGRFLVLDGPDGAGKSTQARLLAERLKKHGLEVVLLREPGGTSAGEAIRALLLSGAKEKLSPLAETFLFQAARAQLIDEVMKPALERGAWVICDRFTLSTLVYQGVAGGVDVKSVEKLSKLATGGLTPDRYWVLWVSSGLGAGRRAGRQADRMESKGQTFMQDVTKAYRTFALRKNSPYHLLDGTGSVEDVQERLWRDVAPLLK